MGAKEFVVSFEEDKNYRRFNATNLFANTQNDLVYLDLFEETVPYSNNYNFHPDGTTTVDEKPDLMNYVNATVVIPVGRIPHIINLLQNVYSEYVGVKVGGDEHGTEE